MGADSGQELPWTMYIPDVIEMRDGWSDDFNPHWVQRELPHDAAVFVIVETWDGATFRSDPASLR